MFDVGRSMFRPSQNPKHFSKLDPHPLKTLFSLRLFSPYASTFALTPKNQFNPVAQKLNPNAHPLRISDFGLLSDFALSDFISPRSPFTVHRSLFTAHFNHKHS
jgi:hypothetical protein